MQAPSHCVKHHFSELSMAVPRSWNHIDGENVSSDLLERQHIESVVSAFKVSNCSVRKMTRSPMSRTVCDLSRDMKILFIRKADLMRHGFVSDTPIALIRCGNAFKQIFPSSRRFCRALTNLTKRNGLMTPP